jgi:WD40 repeat protein
MIHVMDFDGNEVKKYRAHSATVNDISVDLDGEYLASVSDDGEYLIHR